MKKLLFFYLNNFIYIIYSLLSIIVFLFFHFLSESFNEPGKSIINGIADGIILAILLSLFGLLVSNFQHLNDMKKIKESANNILVLSLMKYYYGNQTLPDISTISIEMICIKLNYLLDNYREEEFIEFQYALKNDYNTIIQNISVVSKIDSMHAFSYGVLCSNLNALLNKWNDLEKQFLKYNLDHPVNNKLKYYNIYYQSKGYINIYLESCLNFAICEFEDYSANFIE